MDTAPLKSKAVRLLKEFKGSGYAFGVGCLDSAGGFAAGLGRTALIIGNTGHMGDVVDKVSSSLARHEVARVGPDAVPGAGANAPREDVYRIESDIMHFRPDCIIAVGGGSTIDAAKAANVLAALGSHSPEIDTYFGTGMVSAALKQTGASLKPFIAVQTVASSGAHLTKYSNVTDPAAGQKKLIVDDAIVPLRAVFDYSVTTGMPAGLTADGALDGMAHCLEVFFGAAPDRFAQIQEIALTGIELIVRYAARALEAPQNLEAREALGLATDLGGYAIMVGGTNGAHLTSFSLVDVTSHGRACGIMNPYYTVFYSPAIERQLRLVGDIFRRAGFLSSPTDALTGRDLGVAVAEAMIAFGRSIKAPSRLADLPGFTEGHIARALKAAKDPQLEMKLKNMPVPLSAALVDEYMGPILRAAAAGDFSRIKTLHSTTS